MQSENRTWTLMAAIALVFMCGIAYLFALRYRSGDIYPVYSSLRADPLGTKAFYESLVGCRQITVKRNYEDMRALDLGADTTILWLGDTISSDERIDSDTTGTLNGFVRKGGRVVFAFAPASRKKDKAEDEDKGTDEDKDKDEDDEKEAAQKGEHGRGRGLWGVGVEEWLGTGIDHAYIDRGNRLAPNPWPNATLVADMPDAGLPAAVSCHTSLHFVEPKPEKCEACRKAEDDGTESDPAPEECTCPKPDDEKAAYPWRTIYERDGKPVLIEKSLGKGTIVLSALSYFVSNEAMRDERHTGLLVWLVGGRGNVIFDEMHHGIAKQHGVATLARKYRLHWLGIGVLLLASLFVWKNSVGLVPPEGSTPGSTTGPVAIGRDSASGLVNLLRRNIRRDDMLATCLAAYRQSLGRVDGRTEEKLTRVVKLIEEEKARPSRQKNSTKVYNELCSVMKKK